MAVPHLGMQEEQHAQCGESRTPTDHQGNRGLFRSRRLEGGHDRRERDCRQRLNAGLEGEADDAGYLEAQEPARLSVVPGPESSWKSL